MHKKVAKTNSNQQWSDVRKKRCQYILYSTLFLQKQVSAKKFGKNDSHIFMFVVKNS